MLSFSEPNVVSIAKTENHEFRPKIQIPAAKPEELETFVTMIKYDSPFDYVTVAGQCFQKYRTSVDSSLASNAGRIPQQKIAVMKLSQKQAEYFKERAKLHFFKKNGKEYCAADYLIIEPTTTFNLIQYEAKTEKQEEKPVSQIEKNREALYKAQGESRKKN